VLALEVHGLQGGRVLGLERDHQFRDAYAHTVRCKDSSMGWEPASAPMLDAAHVGLLEQRFTLRGSTSLRDGALPALSGYPPRQRVARGSFKAPRRG
jgi:hypothetical protein